MSWPFTLPEPWQTPLEVLLRLLTAFGCGAVIGLNREFYGKPAGFRTFGLVSIGSALIVMVMELEQTTNADALSRVIQGVITGIGFLGAGVIVRRESRGTVSGLTTAAAIWLTACLGMAAGTGQYVVALTGMLFGIVLLVIGKPLERRFGRSRRTSGRPAEPPTKPPGHA